MPPFRSPFLWLATVCRVLLGICLVAPAPALAAVYYKWVDEYGNVYYGERLPEGQQGAEIRIELEPKPKPKPKPKPSPRSQSAPAARSPVASDFYGLPVPVGAKVIERVERGAYPGILVYTTSMGVTDVVEYYQRHYGRPESIAKLRRSQVMTYRENGQVVAKVAVGLTKDGTQVDLRVEP